MTDTTAPAGWGLDRKVPPIAVLTLLGAMLAGLLTYAVRGSWETSALYGRVERLELSDAKQERIIADRIKLADERYEALQRDRVALAKLEEQMRAATEVLKEIRSELRRR